MDVRPDITGKLVHFTTGTSDDEAFARLRQIVAERRLVGSGKKNRGNYRCVRFSEAPLMSLQHGLVNPGVYSRYSPNTGWAELARQNLSALKTRTSGGKASQIKDQEIKDLVLSATGQEDYPDAGALILLDENTLTIHTDLTATTKIHRLIKILNERGEHYGEVKVYYDSLIETAHIELARTIKPDGTIVEVGKEAIRDVTQYDGFPLYSNARVKVISMPEIAEGSIIEYKATVVSSELPFGEYFSDYFYFQNWEPTLLSRYTLVVPEKTTFHTHFANTSPFQPTVEQGAWSGSAFTSKAEEKLSGKQTQKIRRYCWEMRDVPPIHWEPNMPGFYEISPILLISSFPNWQTFSEKWWNMAKGRIEADTDIREKTSALIRGCRTPAEKAAAIFHYVASKIRYAGLEYGEGGYRPHHAGEIFLNKYGDCKDQAVLLITMLREAGIQAYPVLIGTDGGTWTLHEEIPMPQFDHAIALAQIDNEHIWMDPTSEYCSYGDFPGWDQEREVLVFYEDEARFLKTPIQPSDQNKVQWNMDMKIHSDGAIDVDARKTCTGYASRAIREELKPYTPSEMVDYLKDLLNGYFAGASLEAHDISPLEELDSPFTIQVEFSAPDYAVRAGKLLFFRIPDLFDRANAVGKEKRIHPLTWLDTRAFEQEVSIIIPEGYEVQYLPESCEIDIELAYYKQRYEQEGRKIVFANLEAYDSRSIEVDPYPEYKEFVEKVRKSKNKFIILVKKNPSPPGLGAFETRSPKGMINRG